MNKEEYVKSQHPGADCVGRQCGVHSRYRIKAAGWPTTYLTRSRFWSLTQEDAWAEAYRYLKDEEQKMANDTIQPKDTAAYKNVIDAIRRFRSKAGRRWKSKLRECWEKASYGQAFMFHPDDPQWLQYARNAYGPTWLDKLKPADLDEVK